MLLVRGAATVSSARVKLSQRCANPKAPGGTTSRRLRSMPLRRYSSGAYTCEFQQSKRFDRRKPRVQLGISIIRGVG